LKKAITLFKNGKERVKMRESKVESCLTRATEKRGGRSFKWEGRRGVPDRLLMLPVPKRHRAIVNRYLKIVETKSPTGSTSPQQDYVHGILQALGFEVHVIATPEQAEGLFDAL